MKLIIPGLARTGTRSLYWFFKEHPDIAVSKVKEPLRIYPFIDKYLDNFDIKNEELLFDGTPELTNYNIINDLKSLPEITHIYQIWFNRDPFQRLRSIIKRLNGLSDEDLKTMPKYTLDMDMDEQLVRSKSILGGENIFVSDINKGVERRIENFLGITKTDIYLQWDKH